MTWPCPAYGAEGEQYGALCFFAEPHQRTCRSEGQCHTALAAERRRVYDRIGEMAATGDPVGEYLAAEIPGPDWLLGGPGDPRS